MGVRAIVGGLLVSRGTVLLGKRAPTRLLAPGVWDIFGGHVEPGESPEDALVRELGEELGIQVKQVAHLGALDYSDPWRDCLYPIFLVERWEGVPKNQCPEEHTEIRWFSLEEAERVPLAHPAYPTFFRRLLG